MVLQRSGVGSFAMRRRSSGGAAFTYSSVEQAAAMR